MASSTRFALEWIASTKIAWLGARHLLFGRKRIGIAANPRKQNTRVAPIVRAVFRSTSSRAVTETSIPIKNGSAMIPGNKKSGFHGCDCEDKSHNTQTEWRFRVERLALHILSRRCLATRYAPPATVSINHEPHTQATAGKVVLTNCEKRERSRNRPYDRTTLANPFSQTVRP